jgi:hypothetical protein
MLFDLECHGGLVSVRRLFVTSLSSWPVGLSSGTEMRAASRSTSILGCDCDCLWLKIVFWLLLRLVRVASRPSLDGSNHPLHTEMSARL